MKYYSYFSTKNYVLGAQKNHLMVLLSIQNMFKLMGKKIITILSSKFHFGFML